MVSLGVPSFPKFTRCQLSWVNFVHGSALHAPAFLATVLLLLSTGVLPFCAGVDVPLHPVLATIGSEQKTRAFYNLLKNTEMLEEVSMLIQNERVVILVPSNSYLNRNPDLVAFLKVPQTRNILRHIILYHVLLTESIQLTEPIRPFYYYPTLANTPMKVTVSSKRLYGSPPSPASMPFMTPPEIDGVLFGEIVYSLARPRQSLEENVLRIGSLLVPPEAFNPVLAAPVASFSGLRDVLQKLETKSESKLSKVMTAGQAALQELGTHREAGYKAFLEGLVLNELDKQLQQYQGALTIFVPTEGALMLAPAGALRSKSVLLRHMLPMYGTLPLFSSANGRLALATFPGNNESAIIGAEAPIMSMQVDSLNTSVSGNLFPQYFQQSNRSFWVPLSIIGISHVLLDPKEIPRLDPKEMPRLGPKETDNKSSSADLLPNTGISPVLSAMEGMQGLFDHYFNLLNQNNLGALVPRMSSFTVVIPSDESYSTLDLSIQQKLDLGASSPPLQLHLLAQMLVGCYPLANLSSSTGNVTTMVGDVISVTSLPNQELMLGEAVIRQQLYVNDKVSVLASSGFTIAPSSLSSSLPLPEFVSSALTSSTRAAVSRDLPGYKKIIEIFPRLSDIIAAVRTIDIPVTFLVPDDSAFEDLPPELLKKMNQTNVAAEAAIGYHILDGYYTAGLLRSLMPSTVKLVRYPQIVYSVGLDNRTGALSFNGSADAVTTLGDGNGVVYMLGINRILFPPTSLLSGGPTAAKEKGGSRSPLFAIGLGLVVGVFLALCIGCGVFVVFRRHRQKIESSIEERIEAERPGIFPKLPPRRRMY